jgi:hypothetical protein
MTTIAFPRGWALTYWVLTAAFLLSAGLNVLHVRGGFLTNHLADVVVPAWLYVAARGLSRGAPPRAWWLRFAARSPERAAALVFGASAATEVSQAFWPHGLFGGRFDPLDLGAFALGVSASYAAEKWSSRRVAPASEVRQA